MKNGKIVIFQLPDYQYLYTLSGHKSSVTCLFIDEKKIVSGSSDESMIIWDISTRAVLQQITDHKSRIVKLKFDQDILISCSKDCCLLVHNIFDVSNVKMVKNLALNESQLDNQKLICNAADINKEYLAVGLNNKIGVWERKENFRLLPLIEAHEGFVTGLLVLNDDILISGSNDKTVCFQI
jgi:WD40 repeat protein